MIDDTKSLAEIAFNAYGDKANWKTWDGKPMPKWEDVGEEVQSRWQASVSAILNEVEFLPKEAEVAYFEVPILTNYLKVIDELNQRFDHESDSRWMEALYGWLRLYGG